MALPKVKAFTNAVANEFSKVSKVSSLPNKLACGNASAPGAARQRRSATPAALTEWNELMLEVKAKGEAT